MVYFKVALGGLDYVVGLDMEVLVAVLFLESLVQFDHLARVVV